ncbi:plastocyanin [Methanoculleus sp. Afa-1]|uniref:Plastocyanin n=1 Tax=Methanoculleus formosensis TaxID=2590886 RepID=A0A9E5DDI7_9EURY|nr:PQQ-dependent sugar dehydrogenase [Methanoculleus sp. Afa-1]MCT8337483.1 plastocyanin [Methanoculleus sp. Afa-1]
MTKVTLVIASFLLVLALIAGAGAQVVGSSNTSDGNESSNQTMESMQNMSGNATDLTNTGSPLAAELQDNATRTTVSNVTAEIGLELVAENFTSPLALTAPDDGTGRLFVVDQIGVVWAVDANGTTLSEPFLDLRENLVDLNPTYDERGLLSVAFHPNFSENGKVYAFYSAPLRQGAPEEWNCTNHISEFQVDPDDPNRVNLTSEKVLMYIDKPYHNHNGGQLAFSPADGYLYVSLGDAGRANDVGNGHTPGIGNAQDLTKIYGKVLRIDVDNVTDGNQTDNMTGMVNQTDNMTGMVNQTDNMTVNRTANPPEPTWTTFAGSLYGIPASNPFAENQTEILDAYAYDSIPPEIYAYGFRNPAYMSFDSGGNNSLFVADAGQNLFEEVDVVYRGGNYGWNIREGTHCFDPNNTTAPPESCNTTGYLGEPLIGPIFEGGRDLGIVVVGGNVYRGTAAPNLEGKYVFGYWSDSRTVGNGTLLAATPPEGWTAPESAANLTAEANSMWEAQSVNITGQENETLGMFLRGFGEDANQDLYVLTNDVGGPDNSTSTGRVWRVVAPTGNGPAPTENVTPMVTENVTPTPTENVTPTPTENVTPTPTENVTPPATMNVTPTTMPPVGGQTGNETPAAGGAVTVNIAADNLAFDTNTITVPAGAEVTMVFDNQDQGIPHNVAVYDSPLRSEQIFVGDVITGPAEITYTFTAPSEPGTYYFQCDVHPDMNGDFVVE